MAEPPRWQIALSAIFSPVFDEVAYPQSGGSTARSSPSKPRIAKQRPHDPGRANRPQSHPGVGSFCAGRAGAKEPLDPTALSIEVERIQKVPLPHDRWVMALAAACAGAFFSKTAAGDLGALSVCAIAAGLHDAAA